MSDEPAHCETLGCDTFIADASRHCWKHAPNPKQPAAVPFEDVLASLGHMAVHTSPAVLRLFYEAGAGRIR